MNGREVEQLRMIITGIDMSTTMAATPNPDCDAGVKIVDMEDWCALRAGLLEFLRHYPPAKLAASGKPEAIPETPSQTACREWWQKHQPYVHRTWVRDKHGQLFAEECRLLHEAWEHAYLAGMAGSYDSERGPDEDELTTDDDLRTKPRC